MDPYLKMWIADCYSCTQRYSKNGRRLSHWRFVYCNVIGFNASYNMLFFQVLVQHVESCAESVEKKKGKNSKYLGGRGPSLLPNSLNSTNPTMKRSEVVKAAENGIRFTSQDAKIPIMSKPSRCIPHWATLWVYFWCAHKGELCVVIKSANPKCTQFWPCTCLGTNVTWACRLLIWSVSFVLNIK